MKDQLWEEKWDTFSKKEIREEVEKENRGKKLHEASSELLKRARNKLFSKYGSTFTPGPEAGNLKRDEHGNLLHPKDGKPLANHYKNFSDAISKAEKDERIANDPNYKKAAELYQDVEWDGQEVEDVDGGYATGYVWGSVEDENGEVWEFTGSAGFNWEGDWVLDDVSEVEYHAPDGTYGTL